MADIHQQLQKMLKGLRSLKEPAFRATVAQRMGASSLKLVQDCFRQQASPYGEPWAPLKEDRARNVAANKRREAKGLEPRKTKILQDTGRGRASFSLQVLSSGPWGFRIASGASYMGTHQRGAVIVPKRAKMLAWRNGKVWHFAKRVKIPRRPMLPDKDRGLPGSWVKTFERDISATIRERLKGAKGG